MSDKLVFQRTVSCKGRINNNGKGFKIYDYENKQFTDKFFEVTEWFDVFDEWVIKTDIDVNEYKDVEDYELNAERCAHKYFAILGFDSCIIHRNKIIAEKTEFDFTKSNVPFEEIVECDIDYFDYEHTNVNFHPEYFKHPNGISHWDYYESLR